MASITIRDFDDLLKERLRVRAARNGQSMEEEARVILKAAVAAQPAPRQKIGTAIHRLFAPDGVKLDLPLRVIEREPPKF